jgi:hypothetical protein
MRCRPREIGFLPDLFEVRSDGVEGIAAEGYL